MKTTVVEGVLTSYELMLAILFRWRVWSCGHKIVWLWRSHGSGHRSDHQEVIGAWAFQGFTSLLHIKIPPAVRVIAKTAFKRCSNLATVRFLRWYQRDHVCGIDVALVGWLGPREVPDYVLLFRPYCGLVWSTSLQTNIHGMLESIPRSPPMGWMLIFIPPIPSFLPTKVRWCWSSLLGNHKLWSRLTGSLTFSMSMPVWRSCCIDSLSMVDSIVHNVLFFLHGDANEGKWWQQWRSWWQR